MGAGSYSHETYARISEERTYKSEAEIFTGTAARKVDPALDPMGLKVRESRDNSEHPESNAILVAFDNTGSMGEAPNVMARRSLGRLMKILLSKDYIADPQICFACFGDKNDYEGGAIQIGQFESDIRMDDCLTKMWLVGGGGAVGCESAELILYAAARHTSIDCLEKRGKKGFLFITTDEAAYPTVSKTAIKQYFGETIQQDIKFEDILAEAQEKYEVFVLWYTHGSRAENPTNGMRQFWVKYLGQNVINMRDPEEVSELIAATVGIFEGHEMADIKSTMRDAGSSDSSVMSASTALATYAPPRNVARAKSTVSGKLDLSSGTKTGRL